jgi:raffinose/stachyose/melibiose transport system permease protein
MIRSTARQTISFIGFVGPVLAAFAVIVVVPFLWGIYFSLTRWNGIVKSEVAWRGPQNFIELLSDQTFLQSFWFTAKFTVVAVILINLIGFLLALLVTQPLRSSNGLRTVFFMPNLIGGLILGFVWQFIFVKVFASIGDITGIQALKGWLATPETGFWGLEILMCWQMSGYVMIIYIAALLSIPRELIESAEIDGASTLARIRHITIPLVMPAFTVSLFLMLSNSFKLYDQNLSLTGGGPFRATEMLAMNIYNTAFVFDRMGMAQAKAVVFFIIVAGISLLQVRSTKRREVEY